MRIGINSVRKYVILLGLVMITGFSCTQPSPELVAYQQEIDDWHARRIASLTRPDGWLSLAGLYWLTEGDNTLGGNPDNDIQFPMDLVPPHIGIITLQNRVATARIFPGVDVRQNNEPVKSIILTDDNEAETTYLSYGTLTWYVIRRGDRFGVRLKDSASPHIRNFTGIDRFSVDPQWKITAGYEPYQPPRMIDVPNVTGEINQESSPGALVFPIGDQTYRLDLIAEPGDKRWFIIFSDATSGEETYSAGRFLYVDAPGPDGTTVIDFNKAYNPPCVFTPYATCPLPPDQNHLALRVTAGEKNYHGVSH